MNTNMNNYLTLSYENYKLVTLRRCQTESETYTTLERTHCC